METYKQQIKIAILLMAGGLFNMIMSYFDLREWQVRDKFSFPVLGIIIFGLGAAQLWRALKSRQQ